MNVSDVRLAHFRLFPCVPILVLLLTACVSADKEVARIELSPGDYDLVVVADSAKPRLEARGRLSLRAYASTTRAAPSDTTLRQRRECFNCSASYPLYGWTSVDFSSIGAMPADAASVGESTDPENPGVLVLPPPAPYLKDLSNVYKIARPWDAPIMLIGTLQNSEATRGWLDGGGIGLFVQAEKGRCVTGEWSQWGLAFVANNRGSFTLCRVGAAPPT
jgi:hypothetical protein